MSPSEMSSLLVVADLVGLVSRGPCVALLLPEDAGGDAPSICVSGVDILPWLGPSVEVNVGGFVAGSCVGKSIFVVVHAGGDFGVGILEIDIVVSQDGEGEIVWPEIDCVVVHAGARGVDVMKSSVFVELLNNNTQCALQQKLGVKHGPEKVSEVKFVDVLAVGHCQTWADREDHLGLHLL
jgi:hypothetical protein